MSLAKKKKKEKRGQGKRGQATFLGEKGTL